MFGLAALLLSTSPALAADVLVPEATPGVASDFAVAYMIYDMTAGALRDLGVSVSDAEDIRGFADTAGDACFTNAACPANLFSGSDAKVAVVLSVSSGSSGLKVVARVYQRGTGTPVKTVEQTVPEGGESDFAEELAGVVKAQIGAASGAVSRPTSSTTSSGSTASSSTSSTSSSSKPTSTSSAGAKPAALSDKQERDRKKMGVPVRTYQRYLASGKSREDFVADEGVRVGQVAVEVNGGYQIGDVDRGYGVWVKLEPDSSDSLLVTGSSTWVGDTSGAGALGTVSVSYRPLWFLDVGLGLGLASGNKQLTVGWECPACNVDTQEVETVYDPRQAGQLLIEPRVRGVFVPAGIAKPYLLAGAQLRIFDGFEVPDAGVPIPGASGGTGLGLFVGPGLSLDVNRHFSLQFEVPYVLHLSPKPVSVDSEVVEHQPAALDAAGGVFRVSGGVGFRF